MTFYVRIEIISQMLLNNKVLDRVLIYTDTAHADIGCCVLDQTSSKNFKSVLFNKKMEKTFFRRDFVNVVEVVHFSMRPHSREGRENRGLKLGSIVGL